MLASLRRIGRWFSFRSVSLLLSVVAALAFVVFAVIWKTRKVPEMRGMVVVHLTLLSGLVFWCKFQVMPFLQRKAYPVPWLKRWVRRLGCCVIYMVCLFVPAPLYAAFMEWRFPVPEYSPGRELAQWLAAAEHQRLQVKLLVDLAGYWALAAAGAWWFGSTPFEARQPEPGPPVPPPLPPAPRDEWWKKYY